MQTMGRVIQGGTPAQRTTPKEHVGGIMTALTCTVPISRIGSGRWAKPCQYPPAQLIKEQQIWSEP
jgi:hypothetical protein